MMTVKGLMTAARAGTLLASTLQARMGKLMAGFCVKFTRRSGPPSHSAQKKTQVRATWIPSVKRDFRQLEILMN